jgi:D-alanine-D-alanine ligase
MRCLVIAGSFTAEDKYGRISASRVAEALDRTGWVVDVLHASERRKIMQVLSEARHDVLVPVGFGPPCEDGHMFALGRMAGIPVAGPTPAVGSLTLDKAMLARVIDSVFPPGSGVRAPRGIVVTDSDQLSELMKQFAGFPGKFVVKPNFGGSSDGLSVCETFDEVQRAVRAILPREVSVLVQQLEHPLVCEISCTTVSTENGTIFLPVVELSTGDALVMDAELKFGESAVGQHIIPARLPPPLTKRVESAVRGLLDAIGAVGLTRTDMLVLPGGELVVLEVNAIPGLLPTSIAVDAAAAGGIPFDELAYRYAMSAFLPRKELNVWT